MWTDVLLSLQQATQSECILERDMEYLAKKYLSGHSEFEFPITEEYDNANIPDLSFESMVNRLTNKIYELDPNAFVDERTIHGYIDYYMELITTSQD